VWHRRKLQSVQLPGDGAFSAKQAKGMPPSTPVLTELCGTLSIKWKKIIERDT
jgi:hypothetical protein